MKIFGDFLALILFFLTYWYSKDIRLATAVAIVVGVLQAAWTWWRSRRLETMQWVSLILIVVFGGATIWFNDPHFIMWKPTLLFWASAVAIGTGLLLKKNGVSAVWIYLNILRTLALVGRLLGIGIKKMRLG